MKQAVQDSLDACVQEIKAIRTGNYAGPSIAVVDMPPATRELGIEVSRMAKWITSRFAELDKLQTVMARIGQGLSVEQVLNSIYESYTRLIPYDRIGCALLDDAGLMLRSCWARANYPGIKIHSGFSATMANSSLVQIIETNEPRILNDLEQYLFENPRSVATQLIVAEGIRSSLTCPLVVNGKAIGFLFFSSCQKDAYSNQHQNIYIQTAGLVSLVVEKSLLYQKLQDSNQKLQKKSDHDSLTGVMNHGAITTWMGASLYRARQEHRSLAIIMADLDHFKAINDTYGHQAGDAVLHAAAQAIQKILRGNDQLGRYGGEEFLIVLEDADAEDAAIVAERIRQTIALLEVKHNKQCLRLTVSLGAAATQSGDTAKALHARADEALYRAKSNGRNRVEVAT
ncbi:sensor domain-containing diguanylate cyclase [Alcaligenaceae bacterium CGII-47]|nr:sensor domain-containing diguanylate cyclase [Alcaligenaceae bacterium CGII-47]